MTTTKVTFRIPEREEVSTNNQAIFNTLEKQIGFLPNVYAYFAKNRYSFSRLPRFTKQENHLNQQKKRK